MGSSKGLPYLGFCGFLEGLRFGVAEGSYKDKGLTGFFGLLYGLLSVRVCFRGCSRSIPTPNTESKFCLPFGFL